jgi:hypothetical protein
MLLEHADDRPRAASPPPRPAPRFHFITREQIGGPDDPMAKAPVGEAATGRTGMTPSIESADTGTLPEHLEVYDDSPLPSPSRRDGSAKPKGSA